MKKIKKMLKIPALALMCFGLTLPLTLLGSGDDPVATKSINGAHEIADDSGYDVFGYADGLDGYAAEGIYGGANLDLTGDGELAESGLVTAAEWTFDNVGSPAASPAAYYSVGDHPFAEYATAGKDALLGSDDNGETDIFTVAEHDAASK